jgi:hypothetical protein
MQHARNPLNRRKTQDEKEMSTGREADVMGRSPRVGEKKNKGDALVRRVERQQITTRSLPSRC